MSVSVNRHEIHRLMDSLPPEVLPDLLDYIDFLRYRAEHESLSTRTREAIRLYVAEEISLGRAVELAGMNYFQFEELLRTRRVAILEPQSLKTGNNNQDELANGVLG